MKINIDESIPIIDLIRTMASAGLVLHDRNGELWILPEKKRHKLALVREVAREAFLVEGS